MGGMTEWVKGLLGDSDTMALASLLMSAQVHGIAHSRYTLPRLQLWVPNEEGGSPAVSRHLSIILVAEQRCIRHSRVGARPSLTPSWHLGTAPLLAVQ